MPQVQVKKVVAVCFLEAAKVTLEHLVAYRLEFSQQGVTGPPDLSRVYGEIRRVRDYLQRSVSGFQEQVTLDLTAGDTALLVACCRRAIEGIDVRLEQQAVPNDERQWLERKRRVLADWAVELAQKPLVELPLERMAKNPCEAARTLMLRLHQKVFGDVSKRLRIVNPTTAQPSQTAGVPGVVAPIHGLLPDDEPDSGGESLAAAATATAEQVMGVQNPAKSSPSPLIDRRKIRDPRLRSLIGLDLGSFERAVADGDYRHATIALASILEGAVIDHVIPRRAEFNLGGAPDSWNIIELLTRALGDAWQPKDHSSAYGLFASRNLLRPAVQMVTPTIVNAGVLDRALEFAQRALHTLGFCPGKEPEAEDAEAPVDQLLEGVWQEPVDG